MFGKFKKYAKISIDYEEKGRFLDKWKTNHKNVCTKDIVRD